MDNDKFNRLVYLTDKVKAGEALTNGEHEELTLICEEVLAAIKPIIEAIKEFAEQLYRTVVEIYNGLPQETKDHLTKMFGPVKVTTPHSELGVPMPGRLTQGAPVMLQGGMSIPLQGGVATSIDSSTAIGAVNRRIREQWNQTS